MQSKATIAGILSIVSGIFGVLRLGWAFLWIWLFNDIFVYSPKNGLPMYSAGFIQLMNTFQIYWGIAGAVIGIFTIVAGILTLRRKSWGLALAGAIAGTLTFFPCGIPAIILISYAQNEFSKCQKPTATESA